MLMSVTPVMAQDAPVAHRVEVNGMELYYEVSGDGPPLIVLHGAYMSISSMGSIIPALAQSNRVYAVEFQGHGRTTDIDRPITYEALADDVVAFMDAVELKTANLFGYSMGASAALQVVIRHPEKVERAVLASVAYDHAGLQPDYLAFIPQIVPEMFIGTPMEDAHRALAANPEGFRALVHKLIALESEPLAWAAEVEAITTPLLVIQGDADIVTLGHTIELFAKLGGGVMGDGAVPLPASGLAILPSTSHSAVIGQTELLKALIEPFLRGEVPKSAFAP